MAPPTAATAAAMAQQQQQQQQQQEAPRLLGGGRFALQKSLGCGSGGEALLCLRMQPPGGTVVIKQVQLAGLSDQERAEALNEAAVMQELDHINCVRHLESFEEGGFLCMVMEHCRYGELATFISHRAAAKRPFSEDEIMFMFVQVALGLWHVHSKQILHRDLKSQNIFMGEGGVLKLGDFGIARVLAGPNSMASTHVGTPFYLSPEICQDRPYDRKSDVWALGCVLYELTTLRRAFTGSSLPALVVKILRGKYPPVPATYSSELRALVESLLRLNPRERPSTDAILSLRYVRQHLARYARHVANMQHRDGSPRALVPEFPGPMGLPVPPMAAAPTAGSPRGQRPLPARLQVETAVQSSPRQQRQQQQQPVQSYLQLGGPQQRPSAAASPRGLPDAQSPRSKAAAPPALPQADRLGGVNAAAAAAPATTLVALVATSGIAAADAHAAEVVAAPGVAAASVKAATNAGSAVAARSAHVGAGAMAALEAAVANKVLAPKAAALEAEKGARAAAVEPAVATDGPTGWAAAGATPAAFLQLQLQSSAEQAGQQSSGRGDTSASGSHWLQRQQAALAEMEAAFRQLGSSSGAGLGSAGPGSPRQQPQSPRTRASALPHERPTAAAVVSSPPALFGAFVEAAPAVEASRAADVGSIAVAVSFSMTAAVAAASAFAADISSGPSGARPTSTSTAKSTTHRHSGGGGGGTAVPAPRSKSSVTDGPRGARVAGTARPAPPPALEALASARQQRLRQRAEYAAARTKEAEDTEARRAVRAAQLEAQIKAREEERERAKQEAKEALRAHKEQLKAVQPRIKRSELCQLGADFARQFAAVISRSSSAGLDSTIVSASGRVSLCTSGAGRYSSTASRQTSLTARDAGTIASAVSATAAAAAMHVPYQQQDCSARGSKADSPVANIDEEGPAKNVPSATRLKTLPRSATPGCEAAVGAVAQPPWRRSSPGQAPAGGEQRDEGGWPAVEIFVPRAPGTASVCTADIMLAEQEPAPCASPKTAAQQIAAAESDQAESFGRQQSSITEAAAVSAPVMLVTQGRRALVAEVEHVLADPSEALALPPERDASADSTTTTTTAPPAGQRESSCISTASGGRSLAAQSGGMFGTTAVGTSVLEGKIEALRAWLEGQMGRGRLMAAYRCVLQLQQLEDTVGPGGCNSDEDAQLQVQLEGLLGGKQLHLARHVQKLLMLEEMLYGCGAY